MQSAKEAIVVRVPAAMPEQFASPTPPAPPTVAPTPPAPGKVAISVSRPLPPPPSPTATFIAALQDLDVATVEAGLASVRGAYRRGDPAAAEGALIDQAALLQALAIKFLKIAGDNKSSFQGMQTFTHLGLRSLEGARKTLGMLTKRAGPQNQTNVQVNVGAQSNTNEILPAARE